MANPADKLRAKLAAKKAEAPALTTSALGTGEAVSDVSVSSVPAAESVTKEEPKVEEPAPLSDPEATTDDFFATEVTVTFGDLMRMHRKLGYCMRGNQRPAVLQVQKDLVALLPEGTVIQYPPE